MKRNITYIIAFAAGIMLFGSCKKALDVNPQNRITEDNYYKTQADAFAALVAVYDMFGYQSSGLYDKVAIMDVAGGDQVAGGGNASDINDLQVTGNFTLNSVQGPSLYLWTRGFNGAFRANTFLQKIDGIPMDAATKARYIAEAKALRAMFYFDLVRFFKNVPLLLQPVDPTKIYDVLQAPPADVYAQVEKDLNEAIPNLPATVPAGSEGGRITKGAAQAVLGKVLLTEGKYAPAAAQFAIVNGPTPGQANPTYGYKLLANYADLFLVTNKFNSESILEMVHVATSNGDWNNAGASEGNLLGVVTGIRGYTPLVAGAPDYYPGYGFLKFTKDFFALIHFDPRNSATVVNMDSLATNKIATYDPGFNPTGYYLQKYMGRQSNKATTGNMDLNFPINEYEIRLADTYLLEAEALLKGGGDAGRAGQLINAVRARVGLNPVAATMENVMKERRLELAGEGHRFLDLVRWGTAATELGSKGFVPGKNEIFPIPQTELNNTKLKQSKEYGGPL
ncbi:MAG TPA: RagB/SusD family nutrient uptake outer membrane protein [Pedobacter sp.]